MMPRRLKPQPDDPAQSKRFIDMARELDADENEKGREAFNRAFRKVAEQPKGSPTPSDHRSRRNEKPTSS
jgi:hypothetical protein